MAQVNVNFVSRTLNRQVAFTAIIPVDRATYLPPGAPECDRKPLKTMYLLHGIFGNCNDWIYLTRIQSYANDYNIAIIMPSGDNSFYVDNPKSGNCYGEFVGRELVEFTRELFPLSRKREETFIAGLSMGGFGAMRNGLKYSETFGCIGSFSAAFILEFAQISTNEDENFYRRRDYYEAVFGDLKAMMKTDVNPRHIIEKSLVEGKQLPSIYLCCGTEDFLIEPNRDFHKFLKDKGVEHTYIEDQGDHNWDYWEKHIQKFIEWLPPQ